MLEEWSRALGHGACFKSMSKTNTMQGFTLAAITSAEKHTLIEPRYEKTGLRGFRPGPTQTGLYSHRRWLETCNFIYRK